MGEINKHYYLYNPKTDKDDKYFYTPEVATEIDVRKAYTSAFNKISEIPVFTQFDIWKPFNDDGNHLTDYHDLTLYLVKPTKRSLFFNKAYTLVYGKFLKHFTKQCKIIYYKQPSRVYKVDYRKITAELWKTDISDKLAEDIRIKKLIANVNFGLLERNTNKAHKSYAFDTLREALYYQNKIGGKVNRISGMYVDQVENINGETDFVEKEMDKKYYCLTVTDTATLRNGYIYIKELLLQHHNFKMHTDYTTLTENHIGVWSVKTDAFVIRKEHLRRAKNLIEFNEHIGGWRHEKSKNIAEPTELWKPKQNELIRLPVFKNDTRPIDDEWDTESIAKDIVTHNPIMIRSKYAGGGKSHIAKHFSKMLGYKTLFVVPQNSLSQNIDDDAVTTNKFFAIPVGDGELRSPSGRSRDGEKLPEFDHSSYNCIVFDEIYMNGTHILNGIREFVKKNPNKIIVGAGDVKQLPPIQDLTNTRKPDEYADECINQIFKYNVMHTIRKRLGPQGDPIAEANRKILDMMYDDIWVYKISLDEFVRKYFKTTDGLTESHKNIAYTNMRCLAVSNAIRKSLGKSDKYEVGEILICRLYKNTNNVKFNVNYRFRIVSISKNIFILENVKPKQQYMMDIATLDKHFRYDYCTTCHSAQGASIDGKIVIHEWEKSHLVTREWLWCALTRSTDVNNVLFYESTAEPQNELNETTLRKYLNNKIEAYKQQDQKAKREIDKSKYVDPEWFMKRIYGHCNNCGCKFEFEIKNGL